MNPEELGVTAEEIVDEISSTISDFESIHEGPIDSLRTAWNAYKGIPQDNNRRKQDGLANTFVFETPRIVDALATTRYRMIMANSPPFDLRSQAGNIPEEVLFKLTSLYDRQLEWIQYPKNLYRALKSCELIGTTVIEQPWIQGPMVGGSPTWESAGFVPRPLNQMFFSPNAIDIENADYVGTLDILTNYGLAKLAKGDPNGDAWIAKGIFDAIDENTDMIPKSVSTRLMSSGYRDIKGFKELAIYYGPLECIGDYD